MVKNSRELKPSDMDVLLARKMSDEDINTLSDKIKGNPHYYKYDVAETKVKDLAQKLSYKLEEMETEFDDEDIQVLTEQVLSKLKKKMIIHNSEVSGLWASLIGQIISILCASGYGYLAKLQMASNLIHTNADALGLLNGAYGSGTYGMSAFICVIIAICFKAINMYCDYKLTCRDTSFHKVNLKDDDKLWPYRW